MARQPKKITVNEIVQLRWELDMFYRQWHNQQLEDEAWYNAGSSGIKIVASDMPDGFTEVRPPTGKTIVDTAAEFASGNFPRIHVPRRKESADAQTDAQRIAKWEQGFWYRSIQESPQNPLRALAQHGALRGAICASLLYDEDRWPEIPSGTKRGDPEYDRAMSARMTAWPFVLDYVDPVVVFPDPATEGKEFIIVAFNRMAHEIKRRWPQWDMKIPGRADPVKLIDKIDFITYWDKEYYAYIVSGGSQAAAEYGGKALIKAYDGVAPHGYGFLPYFFSSSGYGMPTGSPENRYQGFITPIKSLLEVEARRMTQMDAIIAQQAMPWVIAKEGVKLDMRLYGVTRVPVDQDVQKAIMELRPNIPIQELVVELNQIKGRVDSATIPDSLAGSRTPGVYSGYHESVLVGTGRNRLRPLSDALERCVEWASSGALKIIENKVKAPVAVWGRGMKANDFITLGPNEINGAYEVYASLAPDLPQDTQVNINNGKELFTLGLIPGRDFLETYAGRENAEDLLVERMIEDISKSPQAMSQMTADALSTFGVPTAVPGAQEIPGVRGAIGGSPQLPEELGAGQLGAAGGRTPTNQQANPGGGIRGTPPQPGPGPGAPGTIREAQAKTPPGPLRGISRGKNAKGAR